MSRRTWRDEPTGVLCFCRCVVALQSERQAREWAALTGRSVAEYRQMNRGELVERRKGKPAPWVARLAASSTVTIRSGENIVDLVAFREARAVAS